MKRPHWVPFNYIYFSLFLALLLILNIHHIFLISADSPMPHFFFLLYALGETVIEVIAIALISMLIRRALPKPFYYGFIAISFLFLFVHLADFILIRMMDMSFWYALGMVLDETAENFIEMLYLTGLDIRIWLLAIPALFCIAAFGVFLYASCRRLVLKRPVKISQKTLFKVMCVLPICLIVVDVTVSQYVTEENYLKFAIALPWKHTLLGKHYESFDLSASIKPPPHEGKVLEELAAIPAGSTRRKPNIYLFVAESIREDFLTHATAPHLMAFKERYCSMPSGLANANSTQISWYSIFFGGSPLYWAETVKQVWRSGSPALQALKKEGYRIHVYSGAQLKYYGFDELLFGKDHALLDTFAHFPHYLPKEAYESDLEAHSAFLRDLQDPNNQSGNCFIIFYDATHFNYSWPKDFETRFIPICNAIHQVRILDRQGDIEKIKNRYRNSIAFVDALFGRFWRTLENLKLQDEAVVIFTADHGEEFIEEGRLFHASHLSWMQMTVPIYCKFGQIPLVVETSLVSHIDLFPSILHYLCGDLRYASLFAGHSLFNFKRPVAALTARYNGKRTPFEFSLTDGEVKGIFRFDRKDVFSSKRLYLLSLKDAHDGKLQMPQRRQGRANLIRYLEPLLDR